MSMWSLLIASVIALCASVRCSSSVRSRALDAVHLVRWISASIFASCRNAVCSAVSRPLNLSRYMSVLIGSSRASVEFGGLGSRFRGSGPAPEWSPNRTPRRGLSRPEADPRRGLTGTGGCATSGGGRSWL